MSDSSMLLTYNSNSYSAYLKEEVNRFVTTIGNKTIVFEKESDPTELRFVNDDRVIILCWSRDKKYRGRVF